jgi:hypothetical protein
MTRITEAEFARICAGIEADADIIVRHNPIGPRPEVLMWMLLSCLISYLNLSEAETPCFPGRPSADTYRDAVLFVVGPRMKDKFDAGSYMDRLENV